MESLQNHLEISNSKPRLHYIDIAKGIGIILVIMSHTEFWPDSFCRFFRHTNNIFYMPMFFLLSGLFYKPCGIKKRVSRLITPFIFFYLITILLRLVPVFLKGQKFNYHDAFGFVLGESIQWNGPLWFLISLTSIVIIARKTTSFQGLVLSMLIVSGIVWLKPTNYYYLCSTFIGLPFFNIGTLYKDFFCGLHKWWYYLAAAIIVMATYATHPFPTCNVALSMINASWIEFFCISILSIFVIIGIAKLIEHIPLANSTFRFIGQNSLIIFATHLLIYERSGFLHHIIISPTVTTLLSVVFVLLVEIPIILFLKKFCPKLIGK